MEASGEKHAVVAELTLPAVLTPVQNTSTESMPRKESAERLLRYVVTRFNLAFEPRQTRTRVLERSAIPRPRSVSSSQLSCHLTAILSLLQTAPLSP